MPDAALRAVRAAVRGIRRPLVLIDGPSGAGKSTFADLLVAGWSGCAPDVVRLDDVYPGWHGLDRAVLDLERELVRPWLRATVGRRRGWDWEANRPEGFHPLRPGNALVIEGCGAHGTAPGVSSAVRVWVDALVEERRVRALTRDAGAFDAYWDLWDAQWRRYERRLRGTSERVLTVRMR
ncbi:ATP-binding protein [Agromyces sp. PvR057]|uniref:ATP-binding protein n=1 Tax=Agromyces sp. PvR057 TaxID=3156403 RepID=UPI000E24AA2E